MSSYIREWLKTILYLDVLLCVCSILLEKTKYESYMKYFSGFLILSCLIQPIIHLTNIENYLDTFWLRSSLSFELNAIRDSDLAVMENDLFRDYENIMEKQIVRMGEACGIEVENVRVRFSESGESIEELIISIDEDEYTLNDPKITELLDTLAQFYQVDINNIRFE